MLKTCHNRNGAANSLQLVVCQFLVFDSEYTLLIVVGKFKRLSVKLLAVVLVGQLNMLERWEQGLFFELFLDPWPNLGFYLG